jgi:uncharacterized iron-regulated protein
VAVFLLASLSVLLFQAPPAPDAKTASVSGYVPERVYDTQRKAFVDFEVMLADLTSADVVFVGEQHDDPNTHRLEAAILEGLNRRKVAVTVSLEMFERDVQARLDAYLAGTVEEEKMLKDARPWPRYGTDYRPLVELARTQRWPVIAANAPRRIASAVAKDGRTAIDRLPSDDRALVARDLECPLDNYYERFAESMGSHPGPDKKPEEQRAMTERYYWSQCAKDETMAESIASAAQKRTAPGPVVHYNGAFHSDFGLGTAERTRRRLPGRRVVIITMLPVDSLDALNPSGEDLERAGYLVYTAR